NFRAPRPRSRAPLTGSAHGLRSALRLLLRARDTAAARRIARVRAERHATRRRTESCSSSAPVRGTLAESRDVLDVSTTLPRAPIDTRAREVDPCALT